ncbi:MAG: hypothetical protein K2U26_20745 [Cyclobacteriaceae bacterium]|nr:hypothetical protein [Cyclobacteriaceae bacterium]
MKTLTILFVVFGSYSAIAQTAASALTEPGLTVDQRYSLMKSRSQTYGEYKVIKEVVLDGFWKINKDSVNRLGTSLQDANATIARLETELSQTVASLQQRNAELEEMTYAGTHINVLGFNFLKTAFIGLVAIVVVGLLLLLALVSGRLKFIQSSLHEGKSMIDSISKEFEEYKRKALERQMKLSRELQDERNRLHNLRGAQS